MGEPQTLREAAQAVVGRHGPVIQVGPDEDEAYVSVAWPFVRALRAALNRPDSLRLDPEDPDVVERLARAIGTATDCGHSSCASGRDTSRHLDDALAIAREWKASALPDRRSGLDRRHGPGADLPNVHERRSTHRRKGDWEAHIARASALPDPAPEAQA